MRYLVSLILLLCVIPIETAPAAQSPQSCRPDRQDCIPGYNTGGCCPNNQYCGNDGSCATCSSYNPQYPHSTPSTEHIDYANSVIGCYQTCKTEYITGGKKIPTSAKVYVSSGASCTYTVECDNTSDQCNGYHKNDDGTDCVANKQEEDNYFTLFHFNNQIFRFACGDIENTVAVPTSKTQCDQTLVECLPVEGNCTDLTSVAQQMDDTRHPIKNLVQSCINRGGEIADSGQYTYTSDNGYDFSACKCQYSEQVDGCDVTASCAWYINPNSESYEWYNPNKAEDANKCQIDFVASCDPGYCVQGGKDDTPYDAKNNPLFGPAPLGYFADGIVGNVDGHSGTKCQPCPAGATTNERGNTKINGCTMRANETKFCDNSGCITLPVDVPY